MKRVLTMRNALQQLPGIPTPATTLQACLLLLLFLFSGSGCSPDSGEPKSSGQQTGTPAAQYSLETVTITEIPETVSGVGMVRARQEVEISPEISGKVKSIYYDVGDAVRQNDVLAALDNESHTITLNKKRARLRRAEAAGAKARKDAGKSGTLFKQGVISDSASDDSILGLQVADADLSLARAELKAAEKDLRDTRLTAPFNGRIALRTAELGKLVTPGQSLFTLVDINTVKIVMQVSELDIAKLATGNRADLVLDSLDGATFRGQVATIGLKADDTTRTFPVEILVDNEQEQLLPGMVARASIVSAVSRQVTLIPPEKLLPKNGKKAVYVLHSGKPLQRIVTPGETIDGRVVIESGLKPGDRLITGGLQIQTPSFP